MEHSYTSPPPEICHYHHDTASVTSGLTDLAFDEEPEQFQKNLTFNMMNYDWDFSTGLEPTDSEDIWDDVTENASYYNDFRNILDDIRDLMTSKNILKDIEGVSEVDTDSTETESQDVETIGDSKSDLNTILSSRKMSIVVVDKVIPSEQNIDEIEVVGDIKEIDIKEIETHEPKLQKKGKIQTKEGKKNGILPKKDSKKKKKVPLKKARKVGNNFLLNGAQTIDDQGFEVVPENNKSKGTFLGKLFSYASHNQVSVFEVLSIKKKCRRFRLSRKVESKKYHPRFFRKKQEIHNC